MGLLADDLVSKALVRCFWPATNAPITSAEMLALADEEISGRYWPLVISSQGDYYLSWRDAAITAGQRRYRLPMRTYGPIKDVVHVDSSGKLTSLSQINIEDIAHQTITSAGDNIRAQWYFDGDFIGLYPEPVRTEGTLRIRYYRHPSSLVLQAAAAQVMKVTLNSGGVDKLLLNTAALPTGWDALIPLLTLDLIGQGNAHQVLAADCIATAVATVVAAKQLSFAVGTIPSDLGDERDLSLQLGTTNALLGYVALVGRTPVVQLPDFMLPALIRQVAGASLRAHGENDAADREDAAAARLLEQAESTAKPRSEAEPNYIVTRNSPLRATRNFSRRW